MLRFSQYLLVLGLVAAGALSETFVEPLGAGTPLNQADSEWNVREETCSLLDAQNERIAATLQSVGTSRALRTEFDAETELEATHDLLRRIIDNTELMSLCPSQISTAKNNMGCLHFLRGQHHYAEAVHEFNQATAEWPVNIIAWRNLAWMQHVLTVDVNSARDGYRTVYSMIWLRKVIQHMMQQHALSYTELREQILPYVGVNHFEETTVAGSVSKVLSSDRLFLVNMQWSLTFLHTGNGFVQLRIHSEDCATALEGDPDCQNFFQAILVPRDTDVSIFEFGTGAPSCNDPWLANVGVGDSSMYLRMLKMQLMGFYDSYTKEHVSVSNRLKWLRRVQQYSLPMSIVSVSSHNSSLVLDSLPGSTQASMGMLNNVFFLMQQQIWTNEASMHDSAAVGGFLEAGVWRGGVTMFMKACLDVLTGVTHDMERDRRRVVYVADSFMGVPPPRNSTAFEMDEWHMHPRNLYAVGLEKVRSRFEELGLWTEGNDDVQFIQGYFNESLTNFDKPLAILRVDADSYESITDVLNQLYANVIPGGAIIIDDWHLNGARRAVLEFRMKHGILEPMFPIPEDFVYGCRQSVGGGYHTYPNKPVQGTYFIKRPLHDKSREASAYYKPYEEDSGISISY
jgi:hypothetical protein